MVPDPDLYQDKKPGLDHYDIQFKDQDSFPNDTNPQGFDTRNAIRVKKVRVHFY